MNFFSIMTSQLALFLKNLAIHLGTLLEEIKNEHHLLPVFFLLTLSFVYGFIHAAGPGHGKTLVASYFSSQDKNYQKAIFVAFMIACVHTFSALFVTYILYFLFQHLFSMAVLNIANIAAKLSGGLIVAIGCYLLYGKIKHYRQIKKIRWSNQPQHSSSCQCSSCNNHNSTDMMLILAAGLIPCPGTITVFLFSITLGLYVIGFLSAVAMSLGMGLVIAITAIASVKIRKSSQNGYRVLLKYLDFGATSLIIFLGILLLFG